MITITNVLCGCYLVVQSSYDLTSLVSAKTKHICQKPTLISSSNRCVNATMDIDSPGHLF